jgi:hypothetical protein
MAARPGGAWRPGTTAVPATERGAARCGSAGSLSVRSRGLSVSHTELILRAVRYRDRAEEIRTAAEGMRVLSRETMERLAQSYDLLATRCEEQAERLCAGEQQPGVVHSEDTG